MITIGIDPGLTGAIAMLGHKSEVLHLSDLPTIARGGKLAKVKRQIDPSELAATLRHCAAPFDRNEVLVFIEMVTSIPRQGVGTIFSLGHSAGTIEGVVASLRLPYELVRPQDWKPAVGLKGSAKDGAKEAARAKAMRLYHLPELGRVKDHNRAEAILIARYGWEKYA